MTRKEIASAIIIQHNKIIQMANEFRNQNFPDRTTEGYKCDRDILTILVAYANDIEEKVEVNTQMVAAMFWKNGVRQIKEYEAEISIHNYIVDWIVKNILIKQCKLPADHKLVLKLIKLKDILLSAIVNGIDEKTEILANVYKSQKCQRNWNLEKTVDRETVEWLLDVGYTSPTKHNLNSFDIVAVTDREMIKRFSQSAVSPVEEHEFLPDMVIDKNRVQNPQTNSNVLFLFFLKPETATSSKRLHREITPPKPLNSWLLATNLEIGISLSAIATSATKVGLSTGICRCVDRTKFPIDLLEEYGLDTDNFVVFLGVGYPDDSLPHFKHVDGNYSSSFSKTKTARIIL